MAELKVSEAIQDDINKGIVRVDSEVMKSLSVSPGDVLEIMGERKTIGLVDRGYPGDIGLNIIRMDPILRRNAKTGIGEIVKVEKAKFSEAKKIVLAPAQKNLIIRAPPEILKRGILGRALIKGDLVSLGGANYRRKTTLDNPFFDDIFNILDEGLSNIGFSDLRFIVAETSPKGNVVVTENTEVIFNPEAVEVEENIIPEIAYEDIGGLDEEIKKIREMVEIPIKHPEIFERLGIDPPKGVLLHGPPGTGKTLLAKAVANETNSKFYVINGPEIMSKFYGQSEENLRKIFEEAEKNAPSIIFIDEIDAIAMKREEAKGEVERRVVAQLLTLMDGLKTRGKIVVIAASNIPNVLDPALRRPGRFDREIEISVPAKEAREQILKIHTRNMPLQTMMSDAVVKKFIKEEIKKTKIKDIEKNMREQEHKIEELEEEIRKNKKDLDTKSAKGPSGMKEAIDKIIFKERNIQNKIAEVHEEIHSEKKILYRLEFLREVIEKYSKDMNAGDFQFIFDLSERGETFESILKKGNKEEKATSERILNIFSVKGSKSNNVSNKSSKNTSKVSKRSEFIKKETLFTKDQVTKLRSMQKEEFLNAIASRTHGFVGADLSSLCKEAAMVLLRRILPKINMNDEKSISAEILEKLVITNDDFKESIKVVKPSALREFLIEIPDVKWDSVGGSEDVKQELIEAVEWPLKYPESFKNLGVKPPKGVLLYGPPGTGKTLIAKAVANETESNFLLVKGPELLSKWVGESEKAVRRVFEKAKQASPSIIFFDEIDSLVPRRGRNADNDVTEKVVNQLLTEIDGVEDLNDVVIMAASNRPDMIDTALLRPGRFDRIVMTGVPDESAREKIFEVHTKNVPFEGITVKELAKRTSGFVGADIEALCREAAMIALRRNKNAKKVVKKEFDEALIKVKPSVTLEIEKMYQEFEKHFRRARSEEMKEEKPVYYG